MRRDDRVDGAFLQRTDQSLARLLAPERRVHLAIGEVVADIELVEEQRVRCNGREHFRPAPACHIHDVQRALRGHLVEDQRAARLLCQHNIPRRAEPLRLDGNARKSVPRRKLARVHNAAARQRMIVRSRHHDGPAARRIGHHALHHLRARHRPVAIGEEDGASFRHQSDLGHRLTGQANRQPARRIHPRKRRLAPALGNELHQRHIIDNGARIRHHDKARDPAAQRRARGRRQRLLVLLARLAGLGAQVDQPRRQAQPARVNRLLGVLERHTRPGTELLDDALVDEHAADGVRSRRRVQKARIEDLEAHARPPARRCSTASRTATPISTCCVITERAPSAIELSISTPRFIGPGCITMASSLASASRSAVSPK